MANIQHFYEKFHPENYNIFLDINRQQKHFSGRSTISGEALNKEISIHQKFMNINSVQMDGKDLPFKVDDENEAIHISLPQTGNVVFTVNFNADLTDTMMGIYPSYYKVNGVKKEIIGTQFETTAARQAFPCVDEPEAKATFDLALKYDEHPGETTLANMPEKKVVDGVHYFERTVRMSTYLIAFAFGELQSKKTKTKSGVEVGVFGTKAHQAKELDFALDIATKTIEFYEDFYETPYPLPHSWQLALPDFSAGAMENWGLVTYREAYLLLDPDNTALDMKQLVATVITHELAHQWFGDLVTMKWWDDLWLNESFANMMEYVAVEAIHPEWHIWELFQTSEVPMALHRDAIDGVQPVHVEVKDPAEIDTIFDSAIVYAKGSRLLVMVRSLIGDDALRKGLKAYFAEHKYGNATGSDLWSALGKAANMDIGGIMKSWLNQPGYPVVHADVVDGQLTLTQKQFFIGQGKDKDRLWQIPLNANYSAAPKIMSEQKIVLGNYDELRKQEGKPFRLNVGNESHFIVKYGPELLQDILEDEGNLDNISQLQLLQDLLLLAEGQQISYAEIVLILTKFASSHSNIVNTALYSVVSDLKRFADPDSEGEKALRKLVNNLSKDQVARLGWNVNPNESDEDELTRPIVLNASLFGENKDSISQAHEIFEKNQDSLEALPAATRMLILRNEVKNYGSQDLFDKLLDAYVQTSDASFKSDICAALTASPDEKLLAQLIKQFENADTIKPQDLRAWFNGVLANPKGQQLAWDWIRNDWKWLEDTVGGDMEFTTYITVISRIFRTNQRLEEFKQFFEPKINVPGLTREIEMDTQVIAHRVNLISSEQDEVLQAVKNELN